MQDDERSEMSAVTRTTKLGERSKSAAVRDLKRPGKSGGGLEGESVSTQARQPMEAKTLSSARVKKSAAKPELAVQIGRQLRLVYNDVLSQPVPDRLLDLLRELDVASSAKKDPK
jgi:hypothetical protein